MTETDFSSLTPAHRQRLSTIGLQTEIAVGNGCCCMLENGDIDTEDGYCCMSMSALRVLDAIHALGGPSPVAVLDMIPAEAESAS